MFDVIFSYNTLWWIVLLLYIPACIALIGIVLLQKGKGVGFGGAFGAAGGSEAVFGPRTSRSLPQRLTYTAAGIFMLLALVMSTLTGRVGKGVAPELEQDTTTFDSGATIESFFEDTAEDGTAGTATTTTTEGGTVSVTPTTTTTTEGGTVTVAPTETTTTTGDETIGGTVSVEVADPPATEAADTEAATVDGAVETPAEEAPAPAEDAAPTEVAPATEAPATEDAPAEDNAS